jgi:uncharacterized protein
MSEINQQLALEMGIGRHQVDAAVDLLDGGATVPFIARYRKEATGELDDTQLRHLEQRLTYLRELADRRETVLKAIDEQGKLTAELRLAIAHVQTKQDLEDLYLPFKLKRRTKGQLAREAGLEPLADALMADPMLVPNEAAQAYVIPFVQAAPGEDKKPDFSTVGAVLDGVRDLLSERWAEAPALIQSLREWLWEEGQLRSSLVAGKDENHPDVAKFRDYFDYQEPLSRVPSHRALAVFRGRGLDILDVRLEQPLLEDPKAPTLAEGRIAQFLKWSHKARPADDLIRKCVGWTWRVKLSLSLERDLFGRLRDAAEAVAIKVFSDNLRDLLLAAPAGAKVVMGLDPGIRTGVKVAVVDMTGKLLATATVYPHEPRRDWEGSLLTLAGLCHKHKVNLIAIGNGTASRETDKLAQVLIKLLAEKSPEHTIDKMVVSEAGASVYSASEFASLEMPDVDVSLRGAASIARRLQDPLAELVKIDPKSIGVGQYQHDVNQSDLARNLDAVVEDCVNGVGVDLNTASVPLLSRVSGVTPSVAQALVRYRDTNGGFTNRQQLLKVTGLGPKTFEQCAGFLRIRGGDNPLDMTGVHPETYPLIEKILVAIQLPTEKIMGRSELLKTVQAKQFADERFGVITVQDILKELEKPGRDPRGDFQVARFNEGIEDIKDLREGMVLSGTVSNVAAFGAFVDLGVHQDGLVHVSQMSHKFVTDAREVVRTGDVVKVKVLEVDAARQRISLTLRLDAKVLAGSGAGMRDVRDARDSRHRGHSPSRSAPAAPVGGAMQAAFAKLNKN